MKLIVYAFLFVAAASLIIGLIIGLALKLIGIIVIAALFVTALTWVARKLRGGTGHLRR
jgi:uncharacterized oligopeptide transporter (OPT) family protein